jgi:GTPase SAR1 family protein
VIRRGNGGGTRGDSILIIGNCNAGKTALYYRLQQGIFRDTHTSMVNHLTITISLYYAHEVMLVMVMVID